MYLLTARKTLIFANASRRIVNVGRLNLSYTSKTNNISATNEATKGGDNNEIVIPHKIERDELAILKALSSTHKRPLHVPNYNLIDDPGLLPYSRGERDLFLAKASGKKSARFVIHESKLKEMFEQRPMHDPTLHVPLYGYKPRYRYDEGTLIGLKERLSMRDVEAANTSYALTRSALAAEGFAVPADVTLEFYYLQCFTNGIRVESDETPEEKVFAAQKSADPEAWNEENVATKMFYESTVLSDSDKYEGIIRGKTRTRDFEGVNAMYNEIKSKDVPVSVGVYTSVVTAIAGTSDLREREDRVMQVVKEMSSRGVQPNINFFNACFSVVRGYSQYSFNARMNLMNECIAIGIEPSLMMYMVLITRVLDAKFTTIDKNEFLHSILDYMQDTQFEYSHIHDYFSFPAIMDQCIALEDSKAALKLFNILKNGNNVKFLRSNDYFKFFVTFTELVLFTENIDISMGIINEICPHSFRIPVNKLIQLLEAVDRENGHHYLPKVHHHILLTGTNNDQMLMEKFFSLCADALEVRDTKLEQKLHEICTELLQAYEDEQKHYTWCKVKDKQYLFKPNMCTGFQITGRVLSYIMDLHIKRDDIRSAWSVFDLYKEKPHAFKKPVALSTLNTLLNKSIIEEDTIRCMELLKVVAAVHPSDLESMKNKVKLNLPEVDEESLNRIHPISAAETSLLVAAERSDSRHRQRDSRNKGWSPTAPPSN